MLDIFREKRRIPQEVTPQRYCSEAPAFSPFSCSISENPARSAKSKGIAHGQTFGFESGVLQVGILPSSPKLARFETSR